MATSHRQCSVCGGALHSDGLCLRCALAGTTAEPAPARTFAGYELLDEIGQDGAMGSVYRAREPHSGRIVALKTLRIERMHSEEFIRRFRLEVETAANLDHPHLLPIHDVGESHGQLYYTMKLATGGSLARQLADDRWKIPLTDPKAALKAQRAIADLLKSAAEAVHHAHERGVLHRDLKPGNLLLDEDGTLYVSDFGLAKQLGSEVELTRTQGVVGTPAYMAPEQAEPKGRNVTARTDVWALGAILYEMLTGSLPFAGETPLQILDAVRTQEPRPPSTLHPLLHRDLVLICLKCLEKDPARRYATAADLAADLACFLGSKPISARAPTRTELLVKWWNRNPVVAPLLTGLLATLLLGIAATTWQAVAASRARDRAMTLLRQIERANGTLFDIFSELDATRDSSEPIEARLARKLVETGKSLDSQAIPDPLTLAGLQARLGQTLIVLGFSSNAVHFLEASLPVRRSLLGEDHPDTLGSMDNLAVAFRESGDLNRALPLAEETLRRRRAILGTNHHDTLKSMGNLGTTYTAHGDLPKATLLFEATLAGMRATLGPSHTDTLETLNNLAVVYQYQKRYDTAAKLLSEVLETRQSSVGPDHPATLTSMSNLAMALKEQGKTSEARQLFEETLRLSRGRLGEDHPDTLTTQNNLALTYRPEDKPDLALSLFEDTLKRMRSRLGDRHPGVLSVMNNLAVAYQDRGNLAQALPLLEGSFSMARATLGADHPDTLRSMNNLALAYYDSGRRDEAIAQLEETLKRSQAKLGPADPFTRMVDQLLTGMRADYAKRKSLQPSGR